MSGYDNERFGRWVAIFGDIDSLANELFMVPFKLSDIIRLLTVAVLIFLIDKKVLLLLVIINGLYLMLMRKLLPVIKKAGRDMIEKRHDLLIQFEEGNSGLREIINYNSQNIFIGFIDWGYQKYIAAVKKDISYNNVSVIVTSLSQWIGLAIGIFLMYQDVMVNKISIGTFFVGYQYTNQFSELFRKVNNYVYDLIAVMVKAEKIHDMMESIHEVDFLSGRTMDEKINDIVMDDISFSYDGKKDVLSRFNGIIKVGQKNVKVFDKYHKEETIDFIAEQ